jgi:hypothetical protein
VEIRFAASLCLCFLLIVCLINLSPIQLLHQIVLKILLFDIVFLLDTCLWTGVVCATGGKKWLEVGVIDELEGKR